MFVFAQVDVFFALISFQVLTALPIFEIISLTKSVINVTKTLILLKTLPHSKRVVK